eukprot:9815710-Alexandrium_andersonii.AAC.1
MTSGSNTRRAWNLGFPRAPLERSCMTSSNTGRPLSQTWSTTTVSPLTSPARSAPTLGSSTERQWPSSGVGAFRTVLLRLSTLR